MEVNKLKSLLIDMFNYRKYKDIVSVHSGSTDLVVARDLPDDHPKKGMICIYGIYALTNSKAKTAQNILNEIANYINKSKLKSNNTPIVIGMLYNTEKIIQGLTYVKGFIYERLTYLDLISEHNLPRLTRDYEIVSSKYGEIIEDRKNTDLGRIINIDIMVKYLGAKVGDYIRYTYVINGEFGPIPTKNNIAIVIYSEKNVEKSYMAKIAEQEQLEELENITDDEDEDEEESEEENEDVENLENDNEDMTEEIEIDETQADIIDDDFQD